MDETAKIGISYRMSRKIPDRSSPLVSTGRPMYEDYKIDITFAVSKERCYCKQLMLGFFCRRQNGRPSLFALAFRNGM